MWQEPQTASIYAVPRKQQNQYMSYTNSDDISHFLPGSRQEQSKSHNDVRWPGRSSMIRAVEIEGGISGNRTSKAKQLLGCSGKWNRCQEPRFRERPRGLVQGGGHSGWHHSFWWGLLPLRSSQLLVRKRFSWRQGFALEFPCCVVWLNLTFVDERKEGNNNDWLLKWLSAANWQYRWQPDFVC